MVAPVLCLLSIFTSVKRPAASATEEFLLFCLELHVYLHPFGLEAKLDWTAIVEENWCGFVQMKLQLLLWQWRMHDLTLIPLLEVFWQLN